MECRTEDGVVSLPVLQVLHLGYLFEAYLPYNDQISNIYGDTVEQISENLLQAIAHHTGSNS